MTEILLCLYKQFVSYVRADGKNQRFFCAHMVDFCRPGHIYYALSSNTYIIMALTHIVSPLTTMYVLGMPRYRIFMSYVMDNYVTT